jgi:hypothetical protein
MIALAGLATLRRVDPTQLARTLTFSVRPRWSLADATR